MKAKKTRRDSSQGFILPLVLIISLIISTGLMALAARTWLGLSGSVRQSQSRQAREIAEAGLAQVIESLNRDFSHLLIKDLANWNNSSYTSSTCSSIPEGQPMTTGTVGSSGSYTLVDYDFQGSPFYGGKANIRMRGERLKPDNSIAATAIVEESLEIKPKSCTTSFGEPTVTSGFPGLLGQTVVLGNNDIFGRLSGNVLCTKCYAGDNIEQLTRPELLEAISANQNGNKCEDPLKPGQGCVAGQIFLGPIDLPPVPSPPSGLSAFEINSKTQNLTITSNDPRCLKDSKNITHCKIAYVNLQSKNQILTVDTSGGPVRIYIESCDPEAPGCKSLILKGGAAINHLPVNSPASDLGIFGRAADPDNLYADQEIDIAGASSSNSMWLYFPDGNVGINGGSKGEVSCDPLTEECTGGDVNGAIWAKSWNGSNSEVAKIVVPPDMGTQLFNSYGPQYALGVRDYVALGVSRWSSWINP